MTPQQRVQRQDAVGVLCPARLSSTSSVRNDGCCSGSVIGTLSPVSPFVLSEDPYGGVPGRLPSVR